MTKGTLTDESVSPQTFTSALALAANGVSIVTTGGEHGKAGLTVSSMCSVCAEPALILACVHQQNEFCSVANHNGVFAINILSTDQKDLSMVFAGLGENPEADRFLSGSWNAAITGSPLLQRALVSLDCVIENVHDHGTHSIFIGRVVGVQHNEAEPLVYAMRKFVKTSEL